MRIREPLLRGADISYAVELPSGQKEIFGSGTPVFTLLTRDAAQLRRILHGNLYSAALAFIRGYFDVSGDLTAALRAVKKYSSSVVLNPLWRLAAMLTPLRLESRIQSRKRAAQNIRFHYDVSNDFYAQFLDSRYVYSEGYFDDPGWTLEQAQEAKLDRICRDLNLQPNERFLDVGCGWGGLLTHAVEHYHVRGTGCTLSHQQYAFANSLIGSHGLRGRAAVEETDYRDLSERFDKVASIGMFEHVGRHRLRGYFRKVSELLAEGGLFLNSGICRPQAVHDDPETWFLLKRVFPGGELAHLSDVAREAELAGFSILAVQSRRQDYARTCYEWVARLRENQDACQKLVGPETYRTWLLYLAASAVSFDTGDTDVFTLLMKKHP